MVVFGIENLGVYILVYFYVRSFVNLVLFLRLLGVGEERVIVGGVGFFGFEFSGFLVVRFGLFVYFRWVVFSRVRGIGGVG